MGNVAHPPKLEIDEEKLVQIDAEYREDDSREPFSWSITSGIIKTQLLQITTNSNPKKREESYFILKQNKKNEPYKYILR